MTKYGDQASGRYEVADSRWHIGNGEVTGRRFSGRSSAAPSREVLPHVCLQALIVLSVEKMRFLGFGQEYVRVRCDQLRERSSAAFWRSDDEKRGQAHSAHTHPSTGVALPDLLSPDHEANEDYQHRDEGAQCRADNGSQRAIGERMQFRYGRRVDDSESVFFPVIGEHDDFHFRFKQAIKDLLQSDDVRSRKLLVEVVDIPLRVG